MLRPLAALLLAAAPVAASAPALSTGAWWEKITVTFSADGKPQSCRYETSGRAGQSPECKLMASGGKPLSQRPVGAQDEFSTITFERRFTPGSAVENPAIHPGDTLLGREVMALAIDAAGQVTGCTTVATSGDAAPDYGCTEAKAERFEVSADRAAAVIREGLLTVLVYGHSEHVA